ncbi:zinc ribbon domain-containing protein [Mucilaginibacter psychrotolerans]|uniref:Zinc-ribbon domain-containing protein n=1 Tax=Mucilaginibacter psychrotolerans TaxID=1524096 RepID=A0A4Y8SKT5_9SPHI|nr:zinc-ribbon domain-containing protein [Mucilaginibacter psychrotolerans]TFF39271.1 zinc-ribbon domain-containing protein [Mucilaginibacter psychrotolerans]
MIIYGTTAKALTTEQVVDACPNCNSRNTVHISVLQQWAHIFWIPLFPIGKTGVSQCTHCKQVLKLKEMPAGLRLSYDNIKAQTKTPVWTFAGLLLIAVVAVAITVNQQQKSQKVTQMIPSLKKGDIIHIRLSDTAFTVAKVNRVKGDSVFLLDSKYQINHGYMDISDLESKEFETQEEAVSVADLKAMDKKEEIIDIKRE